MKHLKHLETAHHYYSDDIEEGFAVVRESNAKAVVSIEFGPPQFEFHIENYEQERVVKIVALSFEQAAELFVKQRLAEIFGASANTEGSTIDFDPGATASNGPAAMKLLMEEQRKAKDEDT